MTEVVASFESITKRANSKVVLRDVTVEFRRGDLVLVRADSRLERTLLLRLLIGQTYPDSGAVFRRRVSPPPPNAAWGFLGGVPVIRTLAVRAAAYGVDLKSYAGAVASFIEDKDAIHGPFSHFGGSERAALLYAASWLLPGDLFVIAGPPQPLNNAVRERVQPIWERVRDQGAVVSILSPEQMPGRLNPTLEAKLAAGRISYRDPEEEEE